MNANIDESNAPSPKPSRTWVSYTQAGNLRMQLGQSEAARTFYRQALVIAEQLIRQGILQYQKPTIIHLYIASCNNLADSCQVLGAYLEAETSLLKGHSTAIALMNNDSLPLSIRQEAYCGLRRAFAHLAGFYTQTQQTEALTEIMMQTKTQGQRFVENLTL